MAAWTHQHAKAFRFAPTTAPARARPTPSSRQSSPARSPSKNKQLPEDVAKRIYSGNRDVADIIATRAATSPATTSMSGWASQLAARKSPDLLTPLGPPSASAHLWKAIGGNGRSRGTP